MQKAPKHIGFIIDGNRRWAKEHGLPAYEGHLAGYNTLQELVLDIFKRGVEYISVYSFSTENWKRTTEEVNHLMKLALKIFTSDVTILERNDIKLRVLGSREGVDAKVLKAWDEAEAKTAGNKSGTLALCFNYGGQTEIVDAIKKIINSGAPADDVSVDMVAQNLYAPEIPPVDLVVRTSGEHRISNFMLWRIDYSELVFLDKKWPDMKSSDIDQVIKEYNNRHRRVGE